MGECSDSRRLNTISAITTRRRFVGGATASVASVPFLSSFLEVLAAAPANAVVRKAAHKLKVHDTEVQLLRDAVKILKENDGIGGWSFLATYHKDFCGVMSSKEIHFGWYFLPWHRVYLAVMERHLQAAVSEPSLAIPYWDWYASPAIPEIFMGSDNPLNDGSRRPSGPEMGPFDLGVLTEADLVDDEDFKVFGGGDPEREGGGAIEFGPHGGGHVFVGGNLGAFATAALDPLFMAHHGNIDRLWEVWRNAGTTPRAEPVDEGWDARPYVFIGADGTEIKRISSETISTVGLGYQYDDLKVKPAEVVVAGGAEIGVPLGAGEELSLELTSSGPAGQPINLTGAGVLFKLTLPADDGIASVLSSAPTSSLTKGRKLKVRIRELEVPDDAVQIRVYLDPKKPIADLHSDEASFAGSINLVPMNGSGTGARIIANVDITRAADGVDLPISEMPVLIVPYTRDGKPRGGSMSIVGVQLIIK